MAISSIYITDERFQRILADLNLEIEEPEQQDLVDRAVGDLEGDLCERFEVPLVPEGGGDFSTVPSYTRQKVLNAVTEKIKQLAGRDKNRNVIVESNQRFIDLHQAAYKESVKDLLDFKRMWGLRLQPQAQSAVQPVQEMGVARGDNGSDFSD